MGCGLRYRVKRSVASLVALVSDVEFRRGHQEAGPALANICLRRVGGRGEGDRKIDRADRSDPPPDCMADSAKVGVGWLLARHAWGRGFAAEGAMASLASAFEHLKLERIISIGSD